MVAAFHTMLIAVTSGPLLLSASVLQGQNLVFNPSFEQIDSCPQYPIVLGYQEGAAPTGWWRWSNTPDYFNACSVDTISDVPNNIFGYQPAYDGEAYSGFYSYYGDPESFREMIGTQLINPLVPGVTYYASMRVSPGYGGYYGFCAFSNHMGMLFTMSPYVGGPMNSSYPLRNYSQLSQPTLVSDTIGWTLISGSFVADSAYQYMVIGNHYDNANTDTSSCGGGIATFYTYYYVDQVCVSTDPDGCDKHSGVMEPVPSTTVIWPNPVSSNLHIANHGPSLGRALILDALGRTILDIPCCIDGDLDVRTLAQGTYTLILLNAHGTTLARRQFMKQ